MAQPSAILKNFSGSVKPGLYSRLISGTATPVIPLIPAPHDLFLSPCGNSQAGMPSLALPPKKGYLIPETHLRVLSSGHCRYVGDLAHAAQDQDHFRHGFDRGYGFRKPRSRLREHAAAAMLQSSLDAWMTSAVFQTSFVPSIASANALVSVIKSGRSLIVLSAKSYSQPCAVSLRLSRYRSQRSQASESIRRCLAA